MELLHTAICVQTFSRACLRLKRRVCNFNLTARMAVGNVIVIEVETRRCGGKRGVRDTGCGVGGKRGVRGKGERRIQAHPPSAQPRSLDICLPASPPPPLPSSQGKCPGNEVAWE